VDDGAPGTKCDKLENSPGSMPFAHQRFRVGLFDFPGQYTSRSQRAASSDAFDNRTGFGFWGSERHQLLAARVCQTSETSHCAVLRADGASGRSARVAPAV